MAEPHDQHRAVLRAAIQHVVDALAAEPAPLSEPDPRVGDELAAALARVRRAGQIRDLLAQMTAELAEEVTGAALDEAMVAARHVAPRGATWAQLGAQLDRTGQWCGQRLRERQDTERTVPPRPTYSRPWINPHDWALMQRDIQERRAAQHRPPRRPKPVDGPPASPTLLEDTPTASAWPTSTPASPAAAPEPAAQHPLGGVSRRARRRGKHGRK
ncbi:hypothetical protein BCF44_13664 [Kutzneria buriramensis]|uniref:Uncharacterized protein n=1 Tax=Kutzneria buriramensis TaxID=1045776 RepID=A0A3E0G5T6_9PSEU|nr:hypothetical protein BCF44_13664 [Kutzneria buriramensis]